MGDDSDKAGGAHVPDTADAAIDLTLCDREPIHIPGAIQPHGLLLIADATTLAVIGGAGDIEGRLAHAWLGRPIGTLLAQDIAAALASAASAPEIAVPLAIVPGRGEAFDATLHRSDDRLLIELEPAPPAATPAAAVLARLDAAGAAFERAADLIGVCERAAALFREITGFERVMIYRFLDDGAGKVLAEDRADGLPTYLNHHFPASDIPRQARALYVRNRVRVIPDARYDAAPIRPATAGLAQIDLSDVAVRSVSPIHLRYLANMGVVASASISIVRDGILWGLVTCHDRAPRRMSQETRATCRVLAGILSRQITAREHAETYRERIRLRGAEDAILFQFESAEDADGGLRALADDLRALLSADGFATVRGNEIVTAGICPAGPDLIELARWIAGHATTEPFSTAALAERFAPAAAYGDRASGLLALSLTSPGEPSTLLMWFRAEERAIVEWAGNPHKGVTFDPAAQLMPRTSFEAWCETVRGRARPWTLGEIDAAGRLRRALSDARRNRRLRGLNRELSATVADREALIAQKDHLLREVNHRVQNSLQLVQAFLTLQARQEEDPALSAHLAEATRRLSAVALVHRRLYQADQVETIDLARYIDELCGEMRGSMDPEWGRSITLDLSPMLITADRAINVGLILTELVINANKYAYGGAPGPIAITLDQHRNTFRLIVADRGGGIVRARQGFGTRMMTAMVQRLGGTIEQQDNQPGLRVIVAAPIEER